MWRVVRVVEGAALEMLCGETHLGFESLTLRQKSTNFDRSSSIFTYYFFTIHFSLIFGSIFGEVIGKKE